MHSKLSRLLNLAIRAATLGCRFLFIFFLAKLLTPEELGLYGLVTASRLPVFVRGSCQANRGQSAGINVTQMKY